MQLVYSLGLIDPCQCGMRSSYIKTTRDLTGVEIPQQSIVCTHDYQLFTSLCPREGSTVATDKYGT